MRIRRFGWIVLTVLSLAACGSPAAPDGRGGSGAPTTAADPLGPGDATSPSGNPSGAPSPTVGRSPSPSAKPTAGSTRPPAGATMSAPTRTFAVGVRQLDLSRGADRPLRTVIWYPASGAAGGRTKQNATVAPGRFPLVLFSHGLTASPESYQSLTTTFAAAGFVVAAPAYPFTSGGASNASDLVNQPADASFVISAVIALDTTAGDGLNGHLNPARVAAGGHSAGGFTTVGMLSGASRDKRLKGAFVLSGGSLGRALTGPATPTLFIHGDADAVVPYSRGRAVYNAMTWPKAFLTILGGDHGSSVFGSSAVTAADARTMIDFLRWTLYSDPSARKRLARDAAVAGATRFESTL